MKDTNQLLKLGLIAMSKSLDKGFWLHGHIGAEILTNTFFILEFEPDTALRNAILHRIEKTIQSKRDYFDEQIREDAENHNTTLIEKSLKENIYRLSTAGHGVIFGTLILKAIKQLDGWLPGKVHDGLVALLKNTQKDHAGRYYEYHDYQNIQIDLTDAPDFDTPYAAARYCMTNQGYFENQAIAGKFYFFHSNQIHDITHVNALVILDELGFESMAKRGLQELSKQVKLGGTKPPDAEAYESKEMFNPYAPSFWTRDVEDEHHFKLAYAVIYLLKKFPDLDENEILEKVSGHWELMN